MTQPQPERARLACALRELKIRTGLSLVGLAAKTAFSKSSWDRYLNGRTLPPRDAVQELCRLAGEPEGRCLALWEIAESQSSGRAREGPRSPSSPSPQPPSAPAPPPPPPPPPLAPPPPPSPQQGTCAGSPADGRAVHRGARALAVLASMCAVILGGVAAVVLLLPHPAGEPGSALAPPPSAAGPRCQGAACEGRSPMHMKCAAAPVTLDRHRTTTGAWLELRYSEECGTSWARMWGTRVGDRLEMPAADRGCADVGDGAVRSAEVRSDIDADAYVYTPMTAARPGTAVRACFRPAAGGGKECFDSRVAR
ncbi:helix-turn-helix domain-containing protein [Streptomyces sp. NBC_00443]|uniref:helix-turn-helix domain-containing protein n=1 Tax=Streptomyces sp. NBC_00443 TaxID=2975743 RepID=UPI002E220150